LDSILAGTTLVVGILSLVDISSKVTNQDLRVEHRKEPYVGQLLHVLINIGLGSFSVTRTPANFARLLTTKMFNRSPTWSNLPF
jgi:hypothetical protein